MVSHRMLSFQVDDVMASMAPRPVRRRPWWKAPRARSSWCFRRRNWPIRRPSARLPRRDDCFPPRHRAPTAPHGVTGVHRRRPVVDAVAAQVHAETHPRPISPGRTSLVVSGVKRFRHSKRVRGAVVYVVDSGSAVFAEHASHDCCLAGPFVAGTMPSRRWRRRAAEVVVCLGALALDPVQLGRKTRRVRCRNRDRRQNRYTHRDRRGRKGTKTRPGEWTPRRHCRCRWSPSTGCPPRSDWVPEIRSERTYWGCIGRKAPAVPSTGSSISSPLALRTLGSVVPAHQP